MVKGILLNLGGTDYIVPPLTLGALEELQDRIQAFDGSLSPASMGIVIDAAHRALKRNYPEITRATVADSIDVADFGEIMAAVMDVGGLKRKEAEAKNARPPVPPGETTGTGSSPG